jgi:hypothetical protein
MIQPKPYGDALPSLSTVLLMASRSAASGRIATPFSMSAMP